MRDTMPDEAKEPAKEPAKGAAKPKRKRSALMHDFQAARERWKVGGRKGPEPVRPTWAEIDGE